MGPDPVQGPGPPLVRRGGVGRQRSEDADGHRRLRYGRSPQQGDDDSARRHASTPRSDVRRGSRPVTREGPRRESPPMLPGDCRGTPPGDADVDAGSTHPSDRGPLPLEGLLRPRQRRVHHRVGAVSGVAGPVAAAGDEAECGGRCCRPDRPRPVGPHRCLVHPRVRPDPRDREGFGRPRPAPAGPGLRQHPSSAAVSQPFTSSYAEEGAVGRARCVEGRSSSPAFATPGQCGIYHST